MKFKVNLTIEVEASAEDIEIYRDKFLNGQLKPRPSSVISKVFTEFPSMEGMELLNSGEVVKASASLVT